MDLYVNVYYDGERVQGKVLGTSDANDGKVDAVIQFTEGAHEGQTHVLFAVDPANFYEAIPHP